MRELFLIFSLILLASSNEPLETYVCGYDNDNNYSCELISEIPKTVKTDDYELEEVDF